MPQQHLLLGAVSGAFIVLSGALYALLFALGRLNASRAMTFGAYLAYGTLVLFSLLLLRALALDGVWAALVIVMLAGYLLAPRAIWHLCVGTHGGDHSGDGAGRTELSGDRR